MPQQDTYTKCISDSQKDVVEHALLQSCQPLHMECAWADLLHNLWTQTMCQFGSECMQLGVLIPNARQTP